MVRRLIGSLGVVLGLTVAVPAVADTTECYNIYKPRYDEARANLPMVASQDISLDELNLPDSLQQQFGFSSGDLAGLSDMLKEANAFLAPYAQQAYLDLAQINIDLADCYLEQGADAQQLRAEAQATYDAIAAYDFLQAFNTTATGSPTVTVPARSSKTVRVRAYCLDGGRSSPAVGEEYYLAGTLDELQGEGLCQTIQAAKDFDAVSNAQGAIWSANTALRPSSELAPSNSEIIVPVENSSSADGLFSSPIALGATGAGSVLAIISILALVLHWGPKPLSISGIILGAGIAATGVALATQIVVPSLFAAAQKNQVIVKATSTGSFTSLDVTITNITDEDLTLTTSCLRFIPQSISLDPDLSNSYDNYDIDIGDINSGEVDWEDISESYDDAEYDEGHQAQRLGTGDVIDDDPPPLPPPPPEPEDTLDIEELKRKTKEQMDAAEKKFKEDPTEENLKDLIKETQKCQAVGCSDYDPMDGVGETWQKNVDQAVERYKNDPSDLNREALERATEIGQAFGSNTDAAVDALLNQ